MSLRLVESLVTTEPLAEVFSDRALLGAMLQFEIALARAEARAGVIPSAAADAIVRAALPEAFDPAAIARAARHTGTVVVPLVDALIARVAAADASASAFVHWGTTSQDVNDTALVLCLARALPVLQADHARLTAALRRVSDQHAASVMLGRTLLQPATPITFGLKAAGWLAAICRTGAQVAAAFGDACVLQFGGASGTLAALGASGPAVSAELARELGLRDPGAPWHTARDRMASLVAACGVYCGTLGKIARDITLLMQHEVAEASEPGGRSSAMPHKRNPVGCVVALVAANRAPGLVAAFLAGMPQEHERGLGGWQAEACTVAAIVQATGAALASVADTAGALRVDPDRMRANISATRGAVFAERAMILLAPALGRNVATRVIGDAVDAAQGGGPNFVEALAAHPDAARVLGAAGLSSLAEPEQYLGSAEHFRQRLRDECDT